MTIQLQFESDGEPVTVEVRNLHKDGFFEDLVFLDYDIEYDIAVVAMGGNPSTALLLHYLWYDEEVAGEAWEICVRDEEFVFHGHANQPWVRLNNVNARTILSFGSPSGERGYIASIGKKFTIEQRISMLEGTKQDDICSFLTHYTGNDLLHDRRLELESRLDADHKGEMALRSGYYTYRSNPGEFFRILLESTDKQRMYGTQHYELSRKEIILLLDAMTDEYYIMATLAMWHENLTSDDIMDYATKIKDHKLRFKIGMNGLGLSDEQRRQLMGEQP